MPPSAGFAPLAPSRGIVFVRGRLRQRRQGSNAAHRHHGLARGAAALRAAGRGRRGRRQWTQGVLVLRVISEGKRWLRLLRARLGQAPGLMLVVVSGVDGGRCGGRGRGRTRRGAQNLLDVLNAS